MKKMDLFAAVFWTAIAFLALYLGQSKLAPFCLVFAMLPVFFETTERRTLKLRRWRKPITKPVKEAGEASALPETEPPKQAEALPREAEKPERQDASAPREEKRKEPADDVRQLKRIFDEINEWNQSIAYGIGFLPGLAKRYEEIGGPDPADVLYEAYEVVWPELEAGIMPSRAALELAETRLEAFRDTYRFEEIAGPLSSLSLYLSRTKREEAPLRWNDFLFRVEKDGTLALTGYQGNSDDLTIPAVVSAKRVINILPRAFEDNRKLRKVTIHSGIAGILEGAFRNCTNLQQIHIPESVTTIGKDAFEGCGVTTVEERVFTDNIPEEIRGMECYYHSYQQYMVDYGLRDEDVREEWRIVKKTIRKLNVTVIGGSHGEEYCKMNNIPHTVLPKSDQEAAEAEFEFKELENGSVSIEKYKGSGGSVVIPAMLNGKKVARVGYCAFRFCTSLKSIAIPEGVTIIGPKAFEGCSNLTDVVLPESLAIISEFAFWRCWKLENINVPKSLQTIEYLAFGECEALRAFKLHDGIQVNNAAFHECFGLNGGSGQQTYESEGVIYALQQDGTLRITGYHRPLPRPYQRLSRSIRGHRLVKIMPDAFRNCQEVIELVVPDGVEEIGSGAFQGCPKLRLIELPASVKHIGADAIPNISATEFEDEQAAHWADLQNDPWARKEYGLYDPINVESKPGQVKVARGSYAESWCKENGISVVYK